MNGGGEKTKLLYENLKGRELYTKSYDEFVADYSTPGAKTWLHSSLTEMGLVTNPAGEWMSAWFDDAPSGQSQSSAQSIGDIPKTVTAPWEKPKVADIWALPAKEQAQAIGEQNAYEALMKKRNGDLVTHAYELAESGLDARQKAELEKTRTPLEAGLGEDKKGQATVARYRFEVEAMAEDMRQIEGAVGYIDRQLTAQLGSTFMKDYEARIKEAEGLLGQLKAKQTPELIKRYNEVVTKIEEVQNHPLVVERNKLGELYQTQHKKAKDLLREERFQTVADYLDVQESVQAYSDKESRRIETMPVTPANAVAVLIEKAKIYAPEMAKRAAGKLLASIGAVDEVVENLTFGDDTYNWRDAAQDYMRGFEKDAQVIAAAPSKFSRPLISNTAKWQTGEEVLDVDFDSSGNIQSVRDAAGYTVQAMLSEDQKKEIAALPRQKQTNWGTVPYKSAEIGMDLGVLMLMTKGIGGGFRVAGMGAKTSQKIATPMAVAGQMMNPLYEQGLEIFDGDKEKASQFAAIAAPGIGIVSTLIGSESIIAGGGRSLLARITGMGVKSHLKKAYVGLTPGQAATKYLGNVFKEGTGEAVEETILEELITSGTAAFLGKDFEMPEVDEMKETAILSFITGASFASVSELGNKDMKYASLLAGMDMGDKFITHLEEAVQSGLVPVEKGQESQFVANERARLTELKSELDAIAPKAPRETRIQVLELLDARRDEKNRLAKLKTAGTPASVQLSEQRIVAINNKIDNLLGSPTTQQKQPTVDPIVGEQRNYPPVVLTEINPATDFAPTTQQPVTTTTETTAQTEGQTTQTTPQNTQNTGVSQGLTTQTVVEGNQAHVEAPVIRKQKEQLNPNTALQQAVGKRAIRYNKVGRVVEEDGTYYLQTDKGEMYEIGKEGTLYDNDVTAYEDRQASYVSDNEIYIGESSQDGPHEYAGVNRNEDGEIQSINLVRPDGQTITVRDKMIAQELYDKHTNEKGVFEIAEEFEDEADSLISEEMTPEELAAADDLFESMPQAAERFIQNPDDEFTPQELEDIRAWADSNEETKFLADEVTRKQEGQNVLQNPLNVEGQAGTTDGADQSIAAQGKAIEDERGTRRFAVRLAAAFNRFFGATVKVVTDKRAVQARMSQPDAMASKRLMFIGPVGISNAAEVEALSFLEMAREMERDLPEEILLGDDSGEDVSGEYQSVKREDFIYHNTGWFKFPDGKWRREMPPGWMTIDTSNIRPGQNIRLIDIVSGPILEMYPDLKNFTIVYTKGVRSGYMQEGGRRSEDSFIKIGDKREKSPGVSITHGSIGIQTPVDETSEMFDQILRHEVQHAIQSIEGFAQGTTPGQHLRPYYPKIQAPLSDFLQKKAAAFADSNAIKASFLSLPADAMEVIYRAITTIHWVTYPIPNKPIDIYNAVVEYMSAKNEYGNMYAGRVFAFTETLPRTKAGKQAEAIANAIWRSEFDKSTLTEPLLSTAEAYELYKKAHGEIEARLAANPSEENPLERFQKEAGEESIVLNVLRGTYDKPLPRHLKTASGEIFGMYDPETNTIFIDPEKVGPETALHEMAEAWLAMIENRYPEMFERGLEQIKGTIYDEYVRETYPHLKEERDILREALAQAIGDEGAMLLKKQNEGLMAWLREMWNAITQWAGVFKSPDAIANMTIDEFIKLGAGSIVFADQLSGIVEDAFVDDFIAAESTYVSTQQIRDTLDPVGQRAFDIAIEPYNSWTRMDFSKLPADVATAMRNAAASGLHPSDFKQPAPAAPMAPAENTDTGSTVRRIDAKLQQRGLSAEGATVGILGRYNMVKAAIARMTDPGALDQFLPFLRDLEKQIQSLKKNLKIGKSDVKAAVGALLKKEVGELRLLVRNGATNPQITEALADEYSRGFTRLDASNGVALQGGVDENGPFLDVVDIDKGKKMRIDGADLTVLVREQLGIQTPSQAAAPTVEMLAGALEPETLEDHIALFFAAGGRISDKSFFEWSDRRYVKDNGALYYQFLRKPEKGGVAIDAMLDGLPRSFENAGDANARPEQAIVDFILGQNLKKYLEHRVRQQGGKRLSDAFYQATDTGIIDEFRRSATAEDSAEADMFAVFPTWTEVFDFIARIGAVEKGIISPEIFEVLNEVSRTGVSPQEFSGKSMIPDEIEAHPQEVIDFVYGTQDTVEPIVQPTVQPTQPTAPPLDVSGLSDEEVSELLEMIDHNTKDGVIDWDGVEGMAEFFALTGPLSQNITDAIARRKRETGQIVDPVRPTKEQPRAGEPGLPDKPGPRPGPTTGPDIRDGGPTAPIEDTDARINRPGLVTASEDLIPEPTEYVAEGQYQIGPEQRFAVNAILSRFLGKKGKGFLLADGTGVGKTRQILAAADAFKKATGKKVLIISENKQIIENNFAKDAKAMGIKMSDFETGTYDDLRTGKAGKEEYGMVIFDEAHNLKNAERGKTIAAGNIKREHTLYTTATPMDTPSGSAYFISELTNMPIDEVYRMLGFTVKKFTDDKTGETTVTLTIAEGTNPKEIKQNIVALRDEMIADGAMIRREYPFYGTITEAKVEMTSGQASQEQQVHEYWDEEEAMAENENGVVPPKKLMSLRGQRSGELSRLNESHKIAYVFAQAKKDIAAGKKVVIIAEGINETEIKGLGKKVPGFIGEIEAMFAKEGIRVAKIYGNNDKAQANREFQEGDVQVVIGTAKSASTGIDLDDQLGNAPRKLYMVTPNYSGNTFQQILGRVSRRNTKSAAEVELVFNNSSSDTRRKEIVNNKLGTLKAIQEGRIEDEVDFEDVRESKPMEATGNYEFESISDKAFIVKGDTFPIKDKLKELGGKWHRGHSAWMFPKSREEEIRAALAPREAVQEAEAINIPEETPAQDMREFIPTKSPKQIELEARIDQAETELAQAQAALKEKRRELDKTMMADQEDLFGERKSQEPGMIFDERVDADARSAALGPYERRVKSAQDEVKRLRNLLPDIGGPEPTIFDSIPPPTEFGIFGKGFFGMKISKVTNEKITRWINSALRHTFTPQGFLNRTTWARNLKRIGWIAGEMRKAELLSGRLKTAIREVYYTPKMIAGRVVSRTKPANMDAILKNLDEMLRDPLMHDSDPIIRQAFYKYKNLDPRIGEILYQMRKHVDAMSAELVALGVVDGDLAISILENMETYLTRSYQVHDDPNWITKVKDGPAWNKARVWLKGTYADKIAVNRDLRQEYLDFYNKAAAIYLKSNGPATQAKAMKAMQHWRVKITQADVEYTRLNDRFQNKKGALDAELEAMLREQKENLSVSGVAAKGSLGSKDLGILKQRKDIPPALLELYGEHLRPDVNYMRSIFKQIHLLENAKFLRDIETVGVAEGWLTIDPEGPHTELIAAESSSVMAPLNGYYTTPELAQAFKEYNEASNRMWGTGMTFWIGLMSAAKYSKTILSWTTQLVNFFSNTAFMWMNGHYVNPAVDIPLALAGRAGKSFQEAWDLAWTEIGAIGKDGRNDQKIKELYEAGVLGESVTWGEINELLTELRASSERVFENEGWDNAMTKIESLLTGAQKLYQFGDNFWKILMYSMERQRVAKLQFGKKYDTLNPDEKQAVDDEAADRTKNLLPTYSLIPKNIRALRMFPGSGTFVSFPYEATRTFFNAWKYGIRDATTKTSYKEMGVDYAKMVALRKIMGMSLMTAGMYGLAAVARNYWDFDDEEAMADSLPPWAKNSIIIPLFRDGSEYVYVDAGRNIPHGYILKAINPIIYDRPDKAKIILKEILEPFLGVDMTFGALLEAALNQKTLGEDRKISAKDEPNQLFIEDRGGVPSLVATGDYKRVQHALAPFVPGAATSLNRLQKSIFDPELNYSGKLDPWVEGLSLTTGLRVSPADAESSTLFIARDLGKRKFDALQVLSSEAKKQKYESMPDEEKEQKLARYRENSRIAYQRVMSEAIKKYSNAIKMKADETTVIAYFSDSGFNAAEIQAIINGEMSEPKYGFEKVEKKSGKKRAPSKKK